MKMRAGLAGMAMALMGHMAVGESLAVCNFTSRSTSEGTIGLTGQSFRVRNDGLRLALEIGWDDDTWDTLGYLMEVPSVEFRVFVAPWTGAKPEVPSVHMLTIHSSGRSSLATHYGNWGGPNQIRQAWLWQGRCEFE